MKKIILLALLVGLAGCESKEAKQQRLDEIGYSYAQEIVKNELIDPASAQFKSQKGFCGEVNSKNKMGGYVGFKRFIVLSPKNVLFENETNVSTKQFPNAWEGICKKPFEFKEDSLVPPSFKLPDPIYDQPKYHFETNVATATPSSLVLKDAAYIYPVLQIHCKQGKTTFALYSMYRVSYDMDGMIGIQADEGEMDLIPFTGDDEYQNFGPNEKLTRAIKTADQITFAFRASAGDFTAQVFNFENLRQGMRKQKNSCNWGDL